MKFQNLAKKYNQLYQEHNKFLELYNNPDNNFELSLKNNSKSDSLSGQHGDGMNLGAKNSQSLFYNFKFKLVKYLYLKDAKFIVYNNLKTNENNIEFLNDFPEFLIVHNKSITISISLCVCLFVCECVCVCERM